jgi:hypothetical protein
MVARCPAMEKQVSAALLVFATRGESENQTTVDRSLWQFAPMRKGSDASAVPRALCTGRWMGGAKSLNHRKTRSTRSNSA